MTHLAVVVIGTLASALILAVAAGRDVWLGMFGPLAVTSVSWVVTDRVYRTQRHRLTQVMISAFAGKLLFFGAYIWLVVGILGVRPVPFVVSFAGYFIALHLIEALWLRRLFAS